MKEELLSANLIRVAVFDLFSSEFAIPIENIQEIHNITNPLLVPLAPDFLNKIIHIRGDILTIFDLTLFLTSKNLETDEESRVILLNHDYLKLGILVKRIKHIEYLSKDSIDTVSHKEKEEKIFSFTKNIFRSEYTGREVHIIDSQKVNSFIDTLPL